MNKAAGPNSVLLSVIQGFFIGVLNIFLNMKLRTKFSLSLILLVLFPFAIFGFVSYQVSEKTISENISSLSLKNVTKISTSIDYYIKDIQAAASIMFKSQDLSTYFKNLSDLPVDDKDYSEYEKLANSNNRYKIVSNIIDLIGDRLSGIYFYDDKNTYFLHPAYSYYLQPNHDTGELWYKETLKSGNKTNVFILQGSITGSSNPQNIISLTRIITDAHSLKTVGVLRIDLDYDRLKELFDMEYSSNYSNSSLILFDDKSNIIYDNSRLYKLNTLHFLDKSPQSGIINQNMNQKPLYIAYYTSPYTLWKIVSIIPADEVLKDLIRIKNTVIFLTVVCVLIILLFSSLLSSLLLKPIYQLAYAMEKVENGDFSIRVNVKSRDETGYLANSFNRMTSSIEVLINKVYNAELKQKEAELRSLQSQINPHFLYNTLESIRGVALVYKLNIIASMAKSLSQLFRYSINNRVLVPISDELQHLDNYMAILNFRHEDKFELVYNIQEEIYKYSILKLTLQPLVENSIKHGLEMQIGNGKISVEASLSGNIISVRVSDNGKGIPPEKIKELNRYLSASKPLRYDEDSNYLASKTGIGVRNVNARLKLHFGDQFGLRFIETSTGAIVEITFSALEWKEQP